MHLIGWGHGRILRGGGGGGYLNVYPNSSRRKNFHEIFNLLETFIWQVTTSKSSKICFFLFYDREQGTWKTIPRSDPSLCLARPTKLPSQMGWTGEATSVRCTLVTKFGVEVIPSKCKLYSFGGVTDILADSLWPGKSENNLSDVGWFSLVLDGE